MTNPSSSSPAEAIGNNSSRTRNSWANSTEAKTAAMVKQSTIPMQQMEPNSEEPDLLMISEGTKLPSPLETDSTIDTPVAPLPTRARILLPALIIPFSILGLLIRLGLVSIETFEGQQVFALAWPQFVGCMLMGLFVSTRVWIDSGFVHPDSGSKGHWIGTFIY
ncbi:hypothetical protein BGX33_011047, partial [Mortierella sp. NVP41]